jgi:hypothetical protein
MGKRQFYHSHSCDGFSARVTVELDTPDPSDIHSAGISAAEGIAGSIVRSLKPKTRDMVQVMRGINHIVPHTDTLPQEIRVMDWQGRLWVYEVIKDQNGNVVRYVAAGGQ